MKMMMMMMMMMMIMKMIVVEIIIDNLLLIPRSTGSCWYSNFGITVLALFS